MKSLLTFLLIIIIGFYSGRAQSVTVTFTAEDAQKEHLQLSRVLITNKTRGWTETLFYPDTTLLLNEGVGISHYDNKDKLILYQNIPNPFNGKTTFNLFLPKPCDVCLEVLNNDGKVLIGNTYSLGEGKHSFKLSLALPQTCFIKATSPHGSSAMKMVNVGFSGANDMEYDGVTENLQPKTIRSGKGTSNHEFMVGDIMQYIGFVPDKNGTEHHSDTIEQVQLFSEQITFSVQFDFVCGDSLVVDYDGNTYPTVQLGSQCWMAENLRTSHYANGSNIMYNYNGASSFSPNYDLPEGSDTSTAPLGFLYNWYTAMGLSLNSNGTYVHPITGVSDICPTGWHVPNNSEWVALLNHVKAQSAFICDNDNNNIAKSLASTYGWGASTNTCAAGNDPASNNATGLGLNTAAWQNHEARYWTSSEASGTGTAPLSAQATFYTIWNTWSFCMNATSNKYDSRNSVRCVRD